MTRTTRAFHARHLLSAIDNSLKRIGTDYVDIFMVHAFDPATPMEETMEALHDIVKAGKARYLGASTMWAWQFTQMNAVAREERLDAGSSTCSASTTCSTGRKSGEMIPFCLDQGIAVTTFSPLARGWLSGAQDRRAESDHYRQRNYGDALDLKICERVRAIAAGHATNMARVAIAWVLSRQAVCAPLISAATVEQLDNNVAALNLELTPAEITSLNDMYRRRAASSTTMSKSCRSATSAVSCRETWGRDTWGRCKMPEQKLFAAALYSGTLRRPRVSPTPTRLLQPHLG